MFDDAFVCVVDDAVDAFCVVDGDVDTVWGGAAACIIGYVGPAVLVVQLPEYWANGAIIGIKLVKADGAGIRVANLVKPRQIAAIAMVRDTCTAGFPKNNRYVTLVKIACGSGYGIIRCSATGNNRTCCAANVI